MDKLSTYCTNGLIFVTLWATIWSIAPEEAQPNGRLFSVLVLYCTSLVLGKLLKATIGTPEITGMLLAGFLVRYTISDSLNSNWFRTCRRLSSAVVMLRAGMSLNLTTIKENVWFCARLALLPSLFEAGVVTAAGVLLGNLDVRWSALLAFSVTSVSPAVVVPSILKLKEKGIYFQKGIDTFILGAATMENVFVLAAYSLAFSTVFTVDMSQDTLLFIKGPLEISSGIIYGVAFGLVLCCVPPMKPKEDTNNNSSIEVGPRSSVKRFILLILFGALGVFGGERCGLHFAGTIGAVVGAIVASIRWRDAGTHQTIDDCLRHLWKHYCEPFFFAVIGTAIRVEHLMRMDTKVIVGCTLLALALRFVIILLFTFGAQLTFKERVFVAVCGIPKGTVQASLGPLALSYAHDMSCIDCRSMAELIVAASFISILLTAPFGSFIINLAGNKLLHRHKRNSTTSPPTINTISMEPLLRESAFDYKTFKNSNSNCGSRNIIRQLS